MKTGEKEWFLTILSHIDDCEKNIRFYSEKQLYI